MNTIFQLYYGVNTIWLWSEAKLKLPREQKLFDW